MAHSSGKPYPNAQKKLKLMQNVWVMYWRDHGVIRPQYSLSIFQLYFSALNQDLLSTGTLGQLYDLQNRG